MDSLCLLYGFAQLDVYFVSRVFLVTHSPAYLRTYLPTHLQLLGYRNRRDIASGETYKLVGQDKKNLTGGAHG